MDKTILYLIVMVGLISCSTSKTNQSKMEENNITKNVITYTDMNNNSYSITSSQISYKAIKKEQSSSGVYSGGKDWKSKLDEETFHKIKRQVEGIFNNTASHLDKRQMMTVMLRMDGKSIITKPQKDLEKVLNEFKPKE